MRPTCLFHSSSDQDGAAEHAAAAAADEQAHAVDEHQSHKAEEVGHGMAAWDTVTLMTAVLELPVVAKHPHTESRGRGWRGRGRGRGGREREREREREGGREGERGREGEEGEGKRVSECVYVCKFPVYTSQ